MNEKIELQNLINSAGYKVMLKVLQQTADQKLQEAANEDDETQALALFRDARTMRKLAWVFISNLQNTSEGA